MRYMEFGGLIVGIYLSIDIYITFKATRIAIALQYFIGFSKPWALTRFYRSLILFSDMLFRHGMADLKYVN